MNSEEKTYLSQEKYDELTKELEHLRKERRKEIAEKLEYAKSLGDLSENTEYQEAREAQANIEDRIATIETLLKLAVIVSEHKSDVADVGSLVTIKKENEKEEQTYELVGSEEADVSRGKISNKSPLGESVFGKKRGDLFQYSAPNGEVKGTITRVE